MLWLSTRQRFQRGDPGWDTYIRWIGLPQLREVRTLDAALNPDVAGCGNVHCESSEVPSVLETLPRPASDREYYLLGRLQTSEAVATIDDFTFLGCDLGDETITSSVLNCGPWTGRLEPFVQRLNPVGLLSASDALRVEEILPAEWGVDEPHARVRIWHCTKRVMSPRDESSRDTECCGTSSSRPDTTTMALPGSGG